jgi:GTP pyrophosphokinase
MNDPLAPILEAHRRFHPRASLSGLRHAFDVAEARHRGQMRRSGDPYITHPLEITSVLAELGMDTATLTAALLHDCIDPRDFPAELLAADFGEEIARLIDGFSDLDKVRLGRAAKAESIRKMIIAMARDPRVLVIKLADRLHNLRTIQFIAREKQKQRARETLEVMVPLAHRLGMNSLRRELEDLAFEILMPKRFAEVVRIVNEQGPVRESYVDEAAHALSAHLTQAGIRGEVVGRARSYYAIYRTMMELGGDLGDKDLRVLVDDVVDCYAAVGEVHTLWAPLLNEYRDNIAKPQAGIYQSLETTVTGPQGHQLEVQIRTYAMHRTAEYGVTARWRYEETYNGIPAETDDMAWMRQLMDWQRSAPDPGEFLDTLKTNTVETETFVFTPRGDVITLPLGATVVDFAYAVHTDLGHACDGARVNGRPVAADHKLDNGDTVEVLIREVPAPRPDPAWLSFVVSPRARSAITRRIRGDQ